MERLQRSLNTQRYTEAQIHIQLSTLSNNSCSGELPIIHLKWPSAAINHPSYMHVSSLCHYLLCIIANYTGITVRQYYHFRQHQHFYFIKLKMTIFHHHTSLVAEMVTDLDFFQVRTLLSVIQPINFHISIAMVNRQIVATAVLTEVRLQYSIATESSDYQ